MKNEEKQIEAESLQRRLAHIGRLSAGIGHNIMTPLSLIMMNADLLTMKVKDNESLLGYLNEIIHQASLISKIAETMMWKVKVEEQSDPTSIQFGDLVQESLNFWMGDMFFKHNLTKDFQVNPHTPTIHGVPNHFTSFIDEWVSSVIERARPLNKGKLGLKADSNDQNQIFIQFEDDLPLPSDEHLKVLESKCAHPQAKSLYPALSRLLSLYPAEMELSVPTGDGLRLRLTWFL
ncbi:MAG: hypothetical protein JRJ48_07950 [Deltaproteobacteria bacterium]|nr:hypothetical protein [Deltaproteobacteria bacterium]